MSKETERKNTMSRMALSVMGIGSGGLPPRVGAVRDGVYVKV